MPAYPKGNGSGVDDRRVGQVEPDAYARALTHGPDPGWQEKEATRASKGIMPGIKVDKGAKPLTLADR